MPVKVSICIPCYNQTEFLEKNLDSILQQTFTDFEVILTDDSTNEDVKKLVEKKFSTKNINYTYIKNSQGLGSPANWNKAVSQAKGEYVKILHHDDWFLDASSLGKFVGALERNKNADFAFSSTSIFDVSKGSYSAHIPDSDFLSELKRDSIYLFNCNKIGAPSATIYRNNSQLCFDEKMSYLVDVDFYIQCLNLNSEFVFVSESLIVNTSNYPHQVTASSINKKIQIGEYSYLYNKWFNGKFPAKKYRIFFRDLFAWYNLNSLNEIEEMGYEKPQPEWIFRLLNMQTKFNRNG